MSARTGTRCDRTAAWKQLQAHYAETGRDFDVREAFATEGTARFEALSESAPHVFADLSKNRIDARTEELLLALARDIEPRLASGDVAGLDPSTAGLLQRLR